MSALSRGQSWGRVVAADAALALSDSDHTVILASSTTGTKAATFSWDADYDSLGGAKIDIYLAARSGGAYTIACTYGGAAGTVTLDAQHEGCRLQRIGTTLYCIQLTGGSTFA